jgi:hypothetical protein
LNQREAIDQKEWPAHENHRTETNGRAKMAHFRRSDSYKHKWKKP